MLCFICGNAGIRQNEYIRQFYCPSCDVQWWPHEMLTRFLAPFDPERHIDHERVHAPSPA